MLEPDYRVRFADNANGVKARVANNQNVNQKKKEKAALGQEALGKLVAESPFMENAQPEKRGRKRKAVE